MNADKHGAQFVVVGCVELDAKGLRPLFAVKNECKHRFANTSDAPCFLHSISDASLINKMQLYREQRETESGEVVDSGWCAGPEVFAK